MPQTPDRHNGPLEEDEEIQFTANLNPPSQLGAFNFDGVNFLFKDGSGTFNARPGANGDVLLLNDPIDGSYTYSLTRSGNKVTQEKWVRTGDFSNKRTIDYTYTSNQVTSEVRKVYASDGSTVTAQATFTYTYSGSNVSSISVVRDI
jgi:hypothetical protein